MDLPPSSHATPAPGARSISVSASFSNTLMAVKHLDAARSGARAEFRVGVHGSSDINTPVSPAPRFALVRPVNGRFVLRFQRQWKGWVSQGQEVLSLSELVDSDQAMQSADGRAIEFPIPADCTIQIQLGSLEFWIRPSLVPPRIARPKAAKHSTPFYRYLLTSAVFFLAAVLLLPRITTAEEKVLDEEALILSTRLAETRSKKLEEEQRRNAPGLRATHKRVRAEPTTRETKLLKRPAAYSVTDAPEQGEPMSALGSREEAIGRAKRAGIVGVVAGLSGLGSAEFDAYVKSIRFDSSAEGLADQIEKYGDLAPSDVDASTGAWGHGIREVGRGKEYESVKVGDYKSSGTARGSLDEDLKMLKRRHISRGPKVSEAAGIIARSGIPYDVIRGQLGMRKRKLRGCFDHDESVDYPPSQIQMDFAISASGDVGEAEVLGVDHPMVRSCIENTLLSIRFPDPSDGESVHVRKFSLRI